MPLFKSQKAWEKEVAELNSRVAELETDAKDHDAAISERDEKIAALESAAAEQPSAEKITKLEQERDAAKAEATAEKIEAKAIALVSSENPPQAIQKVIAARVTEQIAAAGVPAPVVNADEKPKSEASSLTGFAKVSAAFAAKK